MPFTAQKTSFSHSVKHDSRDSQFRFQSGSPPQRPPFNTRITSHRLREGAGVSSGPFPTATKIKRGRTSVFKEVGLSDEFDDDFGLSPPQAIFEKDEEDDEQEQDSSPNTDLTPEQSQFEDLRMAEKAETGESWTVRQSSFPAKWMLKLGGGKPRPSIRSSSGTVPGTSL